MASTISHHLTSLTPSIPQQFTTTLPQCLFISQIMEKDIKLPRSDGGFHKFSTIFCSKIRQNNTSLDDWYLFLWFYYTLFTCWDVCLLLNIWYFYSEFSVILNCQDHHFFHICTLQSEQCEAHTKMLLLFQKPFLWISPTWGQFFLELIVDSSKIFLMFGKANHADRVFTCALMHSWL